MRICAGLLLLAAIIPYGALSAATYHVDSLNGDDTRSGREPEVAWKSLQKVNGLRLEPGDRVLFKAGGRWTGALQPKGSGREDARIVIGKYGEGSLPRIDGQGLTDEAVLLENISHVTLRDLEITNQGPERKARRCGVRIIARGMGKMKDLHVDSLIVHDVNSELKKAKEGSGILFETMGGNDDHFDGLTIENCRLERVDRNGICQHARGKTRSLNVIIRRNVLEDIGGDGIKLWGTNGGLIEHNIVRKARARGGVGEAAAGIWPFACDDTVIQFNEVSGTIGTKDGQSFDADYNCRRTLIQYNYSHGNEGGFLLVCGPGRSFNEDTVVRYNLSVNDGINTARVFHFGGASQRTRVYNNTVILGPHQDLPMFLFTEWAQGIPTDVVFSNNLFAVRPGGRATYKFVKSNGIAYRENRFVGNHEGLPDGLAALADDAKLSGVAEPKPRMAAMEDFEPSDVRNHPRGVVIENNGGRDLLGNPLPQGAPMIGAFEMSE